MRPESPTHLRHGFAALLLISATMSAAFATQEPPALVVEESVDGTPAARIGISVGDRLVRYGEQPLPSPEALRAAEEHPLTGDVVLRIRRGGDTLTLTAPAGKLGIRVRPELPASALRLYEEGRAAEKAQKTDDAISKWTAAARAAEEAGHGTVAAWLYGLAGESREGQRQWKLAAEAHLAAFSLLKHGSDRASQARRLTALGRCSLNLNDFPAAEQWYRQAVQVDSAAGYERWAAASFTSLGHVAFYRSQFVEAEDSYRRALEIHERLAPDSLHAAGALNNLGNVARNRGDLEAAQNHFRRSLAINERVAPDSLDVANNLNNLGLVARNRGDLAAAQDYHRRALVITERLSPQSRMMVATLNNLGLVSGERGDLMAAQDYHARTLAINERLAPDSLPVAGSLVNLADIARSRGDLSAARHYLGRALAIQERLAPNSVTVADSLANLGEIAQSRGDLNAAQDYYSRALGIRETLAPDSLRVAKSLHGLGSVAWSRGDAAGAKDYHTRALDIRQRLAPGSLDAAASLADLGGIALGQQRYADAVPLFTRAVSIIEGQRWRIRSTEARAWLLALHTAPYSGLLRTYLALEDLPAAFGMAERMRARSLLEILTEAGAEIRQGVDPALRERERLLQQQLNDKANRHEQILSGKHTAEQAAAATKELDALLIQYQELQAQLRIHSPRYAALTESPSLTLPDIQQQLLDENTLLLEYALADEKSFVFAVTRTSIHAFELPARAVIEQAARRVSELQIARQLVRGETVGERRARIEKADADYATAAATLSRMVLGPVAGHLSNQTLLIVADGALQYVPFGALPMDDGQPLVVSHVIVNLPSASVVAVQRRELQGRPPAAQRIAVLADPVFDAEDARVKGRRAAGNAGLVGDRGSLSRLPFTRDEADAILSVSPGESTRAVDFKASRATVTSPGFARSRIVHMATHGVLNPEHPELSGIVLSLVDEQGKAQDGFLRLHEIYNLNWSADLVVLSGCQTALGKEIRGEGLVGLTRGFMHAGARSVLASLWNVNDSVTAELMKQFYRGMFVEKLPPGAALRAAQVAMWKRNQSRSPYYWAAFVLQGDWR